MQGRGWIEDKNEDRNDRRPALRKRMNRRKGNTEQNNKSVLGMAMNKGDFKKKEKETEFRKKKLNFFSMRICNQVLGSTFTISVH